MKVWFSSYGGGVVSLVWLSNSRFAQPSQRYNRKNFRCATHSLYDDDHARITKVLSNH